MDLTGLGDEYVEEFTHFLRFLERFGLAPGNSRTGSLATVVQKPTFAEFGAEFDATRVKTAY